MRDDRMSGHCGYYSVSVEKIETDFGFALPRDENWTILGSRCKRNAFRAMSNVRHEEGSSFSVKIRVHAHIT